MSTESNRTALMVAAYRARATDRKDAICNDPFAAELAGEDGLAIASAYDAVYPHMELWIAVRTAFIDDVVRRFSELGQVVILGAGFDTRAARLARPGARFFEVDQGAVQKEKRERLARIDGYPDTATYVTCNFEREDFGAERRSLRSPSAEDKDFGAERRSLRSPSAGDKDFLDRLRAEGFDASSPAVFVWEGVTPYLTEPAVRATLRRIAQGTEERSVLVFDHLRRKIVAGDVRNPKDLESRAFVAELGEPLRFGIDYPLPMLYEEGFRKVRALTFDELCLDLTGTYDRERAFRFQGVVLASRATRL